MQYVNKLGQFVGESLPDWKPCPLPQPVILTGRSCRLEPISVDKHFDDLFAAYIGADERLWTYTRNEAFTISINRDDKSEN